MTSDRISISDTEVYGHRASGPATRSPSGEYPAQNQLDKSPPLYRGAVEGVLRPRMCAAGILFFCSFLGCAQTPPQVPPVQAHAPTQAVAPTPAKPLPSLPNPGRAPTFPNRSATLVLTPLMELNGKTRKELAALRAQGQKKNPLFVGLATHEVLAGPVWAGVEDGKSWSGVHGMLFGDIGAGTTHQGLSKDSFVLLNPFIPATLDPMFARDGSEKPGSPQEMEQRWVASNTPREAAYDAPGHTFKVRYVYQDNVNPRYPRVCLLNLINARDAGFASFRIRRPQDHSIGTYGPDKAQPNYECYTCPDYPKYPKIECPTGMSAEDIAKAQARPDPPPGYKLHQFNYRTGKDPVAGTNSYSEEVTIEEYPATIHLDFWRAEASECDIQHPDCSEIIEISRG